MYECEELAKDHGFDKATFDLCGPFGRKKAKWLDAYFGMFCLEGDKGFMTVKSVMPYGVWAENFDSDGASA